MLCKRTAKNQITIPKRIADRFKAIEYFSVEVEDNSIVMRPIRMENAQKPALESIRTKIAQLGITETDIVEAIESARGKDR